jgi:hypothetical protein
MANEDYLNFRLEKFLDSITNKKTGYKMTILGEDGIIEGTLSEFENLISELAKNNIELAKELKQQLQDKQEYVYDFELGEIEIYNYLEKITSNFEPEKTRIVLSEIEAYYTMVFKERIIEESIIEYQKNNWEIPKKKLNLAFPFKSNDVEIPDIDKMLHKTHLFEGFAIKRAIFLLKRKLRVNESKTACINPNRTEPTRDEVPNNDKEPENPHPRIFLNYKCWQLFEYWRNEVKERTQLAEFSFIFWQMQKDSLIYEDVKPTEFRNWMLKTFSIDLEPLKQLTVCKGGNKYSRYQSAKLLFKC